MVSNSSEAVANGPSGERATEPMARPVSRWTREGHWAPFAVGAGGMHFRLVLIARIDGTGQFCE